MEHSLMNKIPLFVFLLLFVWGTTYYFLDKKKDYFGDKDERLSYPMFMLAFFFIITPTAVWQMIKWLCRKAAFLLEELKWRFISSILLLISLYNKAACSFKESKIFQSNPTKGE